MDDMKFDCGETTKEYFERIKQWQDHFCIIPKRVAPHDCRWLETVQRRGEYANYMTGVEWEYRVKE